MEDLKYCLITGASRGIGRDLAKEFARNGHALILVARDKVALTVLKDELHAYTPDIKLYQYDLADEESCNLLMTQLKQQQLQIDILINNAGFGLCEEFINISPEVMTQMIKLNILSLTLLTRHLLPDMVRRKKGHICNVASTAAYLPGPSMAIYYASKSYVLSLTEALAQEVHHHHVTVTALCPGATHSDFKRVAKTINTRLIKYSKEMPSAKVARIAYRGILRGKRVIVPGLLNKVMVFLIKITPNFMLGKIVKFLHAK